MTLPQAPADITVHDLDPNAPIPEGYVLVDVREADEWEAGHAPNAIHIPLREIPARLGDLPERDEIILVCRRGGRSFEAQRYLAANGFDCLNLAGGMQQWQAAGLPLEADCGTPTVI